MKKIFVTILISFSLISAGSVLAHTDSDTTNPMEQMMRQMMGDQTFETMEKIENQMMGEENHARMEELMNKMFAGNLSPDEQKEMIQMMQDNMTGPGMMTMMMRMMLAQYGSRAFPSGIPQMMQNSGIYWITVILVWTVLILTIIAIIKWLKKK